MHKKQYYKDKMGLELIGGSNHENDCIYRIAFLKTN